MLMKEPCFLGVAHDFSANVLYYMLYIFAQYTSNMYHIEYFVNNFIIQINRQLVVGIKKINISFNKRWLLKTNQMCLYILPWILKYRIVCGFGHLVFCFYPFPLQYYRYVLKKKNKKIVKRSNHHSRFFVILVKKVF